MAVQNQTYNFNYPNMNFGQTLLTGMLGSLTGCMGMNGSLFSMTGMGGIGGGCCSGGYGMSPFPTGYYYSDQALGFQIGSLTLNYGMMALNQIFDGRGGKNDKSTDDKISDVNKQAATYLKDIPNCDSLDEFNPSITVDSIVCEGDERFDNWKKYDGLYSNAKTTLEQAEKALTDAGLTTSVPQKSDPKYINPETNEFDQAKFDAEYKLWIAYDKAKTEEANAKKELDAAKKSLETYKGNVATSIQELKSLKIEYGKLLEQQKQEEKAAEQAELMQQINDVDGYAGARTKKSKLEAKMNGVNKESWDVDDLQGALAAYRKNPSERDKWIGVLKDIISKHSFTIEDKYKNVLKSIPEIKNDKGIMTQLG